MARARSLDTGHRDGHAPGTLLGHMLLGCTRAGAAGVGGSRLEQYERVRADVAGEMEYLEVVLPLPPEAQTCDNDDDDLYELELSEDAAALARGACARNFVAVDGALEQLVVFEDASALHRTPLAAMGAPEEVGGLKACRNIARVQFYATQGACW